MKFEKLTENKIRIILNLKDLEEKNIDFHSFMSNSVESQDLFLDVLEKAEKEVGFVTKDYKLMIEAIATSDGNFILTVTRISPEGDVLKPFKKKLNVKRKLVLPNKQLSIYCFNNFNNFCDFCTYLTTNPLYKLNSRFKKSKLFLYKNKYYFILKDVTLSANNMRSLHCSITEFADFISNSELFERKLAEHGSIIINSNAINTCIKYFN